MADSVYGVQHMDHIVRSFATLDEAKEYLAQMKAESPSKCWTIDAEAAGGSQFEHYDDEGRLVGLALTGDAFLDYPIEEIER